MVNDKEIAYVKMVGIKKRKMREKSGKFSGRLNKFFEVKKFLSFWSMREKNYFSYNNFFIFKLKVLDLLNSQFF
jgi:hypothetical protein